MYVYSHIYSSVVYIRVNELFLYKYLHIYSFRPSVRSMCPYWWTSVATSPETSEVPCWTCWSRAPPLCRQGTDPSSLTSWCLTPPWRSVCPPPSVRDHRNSTELRLDLAPWWITVTVHELLENTQTYTAHIQCSAADAVSFTHRVQFKTSSLHLLFLSCLSVSMSFAAGSGSRELLKYNYLFLFFSLFHRFRLVLVLVIICITGKTARFQALNIDDFDESGDRNIGLSWRDVH